MTRTHTYTYTRTFTLPEYYVITNVGTFMQTPLPKKMPNQMVLHQVLAANPNYFRAVKRMQHLYKPRIILDNGAHEDCLASEEAYKGMIEELQPDVVVLPDLIGQRWEDSFKVSLKFSEWMIAHFPQMEMIFACQGEDPPQTLKAYAQAYRELPADKFIIGFGQSYLCWQRDGLRDDMARRELMYRLIKYMGFAIDDVQHRGHILGGRWNTCPMDECYQQLNITGLDSVKPCTCAVQGTTYPVRTNGKIDLADMSVPHSIGSLVQNINTFIDAYQLAPIDWPSVWMK